MQFFLQNSLDLLSPPSIESVCVCDYMCDYTVARTPTLLRRGTMMVMKVYHRHTRTRNTQHTRQTHYHLITPF